MSQVGSECGEFPCRCGRCSLFVPAINQPPSCPTTLGGETWAGVTRYDPAKLSYALSSTDIEAIKAQAVAEERGRCLRVVDVLFGEIQGSHNRERVYRAAELIRDVVCLPSTASVAAVGMTASGYGVFDGHLKLADCPTEAAAQSALRLLTSEPRS